MNVTFFKNKKEFKDFEERLKKEGKYLGSGYEGYCYDLNGEAYKVIVNSTKIKMFQPNYEDIITTSLIDVPSFALPTHLYILDGMLKCYRAKVIKNNIFTDWRKPSERKKALPKLDIEKLRLAYKKMEDDVYKISEFGIETNDLENNLLFGEDGLVAIDTICYKKGIDCLEYNLRSFRFAIENKFNSLIPHVLVKQTPYIEQMGIDIYLGEVEKVIRKNYNHKK